MRRFPTGETVYLHRNELKRDSAGEVVRNGYGEAEYELTLIPISGCAVSPGGSMGQAFSFEAVGGRQSQVSERFIIYFPPNTAVDSNDRVTWRDKVYEVEGEPGYSRSPFSGIDGPIETYLKRVTG